MPQVPYSPVPDVAPQNIPTPSISVNTPSDAFGGDIAQATSRFGQTADKVGDELFTRANAMQQLHTETIARDADTQYMIQAGNLHADFTAKRGLDAGPEAFDQYQKNLQDARTNIGQNLPYDAARKLYDASSMRVMGQTIFNGAGHSGQQLKEASAQSARSSLQASIDTAVASPEDNNLYQTNLQKAEAAAVQSSQVAGADDATTQQNIAAARSEVTIGRLQGYLSKNQPEIAQSLLTKALSSGDIRGEKIASIAGAIDRSLLNVGAKNAANGIETGTSMAMGKGAVTMDRAMDAIGGFESGGRYDATGKMLTKKDGSSDQALGKYQIMQSNLPSWLKQAGLPAMTPQQFLGNPNAQDQVFNKVFGDAMKQYGNFNDAASVWLSGKPVAEAGPNVADANGTTVPKYLMETNRLLAKSAPLSERVNAARDQAAQIAPNQPLMADQAAAHVIQQDGQQRAIERQDSFSRMGVIDSRLTGENGPIPPTMEQLLQDPDTKKAYDSMSDKEQLQAQRKLKVASANDNNMTTDRVKNMQQLMGMAGTDPDAFMSKDVFSEDLMANDRKTLVAERAKIAKGGAEDPKIGQAMSVLTPTLYNAGIVPESKADYNQFRGGLAIAIQQFQQERGRAPGRNDIQEIGSQLLRNHSQPGMLWGTNDTPVYREAPPEAAKQKILGMSKWGGRTPTDDEIQSTYTQALYNSLYAKKKAQ